MNKNLNRVEAVAKSEKQPQATGGEQGSDRLMGPASEPFSPHTDTEELGRSMLRARALQVVPLVPDERAELSALDPATAFRRYSSYVAAIAYRLLGRDHEVDDTVQEVFLASVRGLATVREPGAVKAWLARVTVRVARRRLRVRRVRAMFGIDQVPPALLVVDDSANPEQRALLSSIYRILDLMPADHRIAWTLRHMEGERLEDVATLVGCSLATAKRRIAAADKLLQEALDEG